MLSIISYKMGNFITVVEYGIFIKFSNGMKLFNLDYLGKFEVILRVVEIIEQTTEYLLSKKTSNRRLTHNFSSMFV